MNIVAIIQARCGSTRLPNKVLMDIAGQPMFSRVVQRARQAKTLTEVVLATSTDPRNEPLASLATSLGVRFCRGSEHDVLSRFVGAVHAFDADVVVRLTADCPLLDAAVIDRMVQVFRGTNVDYVSNTLERTYPDGLDVEVISREALTRAHSEARLPSEREHVTSYIYKHPELFSLLNVKHSSDLSAYRLTVDEPADLEVVRRIYQHFQHHDFGLMEMTRFLMENPEVRQLNQKVARYEGYRQALENDEKPRLVE